MMRALSALAAAITWHGCIAFGGLPDTADNHDNLYHTLKMPLEPNHFAPNIACCTDLSMPAWVADAVDSARTPDTDKSACTCPGADVFRRAVPGSMPSTSGLAIPLPRVSATTMSTPEFFWQFAYRGLPFIVTGFEEMEWWDGVSTNTTRCADAEYALGLQKYRTDDQWRQGKSHGEGCNAWETWCLDKPLPVKRCKKKGRVRHRAQGPRFLRDVPAALYRPDERKDSWLADYGRDGAREDDLRRPLVHWLSDVYRLPVTTDFVTL